MIRALAIVSALLALGAGAARKMTYEQARGRLVERPLPAFWVGDMKGMGINPMHDEFFAPMSTEAPAILRVAIEEAPDLAVSLHSHEAAPAILRPAFVPMEIQADAAKLAGRLDALSKERNLPYGRAFTPVPERGNPPASFNLVSALYHVSGATAFTFECPHGVASEKACQVTFDQILDIQLALYEAMMRYAIAGKNGE